MERGTEPDLPMSMRIRGVEARPATADPREYIRYLVETKCNVSTIGSMFGTGWALFPTERLPTSPQMDPDWIPSVLDEAHRYGIKLTCWNCFNIQDTRRVEDFQPAKRFPQWTMKYIEDPDREYPPRVGMCLLSSPYIQHHAEFLKEVVRLGVDAMWFDGFYLGGAPHPLQPGCVCEFCREQFRKDYGLALPTKVDWTDLTFKKWVRWRNERLVATANHFTREIQSVNAEVPVTCNYNMWPFGTKDWQTGIPLWRTSDYGVSQHAYSGSDNLRWIMLGYKGRLSHDLNPDYSDMWRTGGPSFNHEGTPEDDERYERNMMLFVLGGPTYGTIPWRSRQFPRVIRKGNEALLAVEKYFSKEQIRHVGVLISQNTHDFWGHTPGTTNLVDYRDAVLGTWLLLTERHVPFEFLFDNQLEKGEIEDFRVLVLPHAACLSDRQAQVLRDWAASGGVLIASGATGRYDEWGEKRQANALGALLSEPLTRVGAGTVCALPEDPGSAYGRHRDVALGNRLLTHIERVPTPLEVDAPASLAVNTFWSPERDELWVQMLNVSYFYMYGRDCGFRGVERPPTSAEDLASDGQLVDVSEVDTASKYRHVPACDVRVTVKHWEIASARTVRSGQTLAVGIDGTVVVPHVDLHEVLVLRLK